MNFEHETVIKKQLIYKTFSFDPKIDLTLLILIRRSYFGLAQRRLDAPIPEGTAA